MDGRSIIAALLATQVDYAQQVAQLADELDADLSMVDVLDMLAQLGLMLVEGPGIASAAYDAVVASHARRPDLN